MIAPDETTFAYLKGRRFSPGTNLLSSHSTDTSSPHSTKSSSSHNIVPLSSHSTDPLSSRSEAEGSASPSQIDEAAWNLAVQNWQALVTDEGATFDRELTIDAAKLAPRVTWGTSPGMVTSIEGRVPSLADALSDADRKSFERAFEYMALEPGTPMEEVRIDAVFLGSCTNGRIEDLRAAAKVVKGHHIATTVRAMVVPGSQVVKRQAEAEGLDEVFKQAGFEWREPGCSMCLGMNPDILQPGERCASTSNRNFEGRQGRGGRTHLLSPEMAAAAAITGRLTDVRKWKAALGPSSSKPAPDVHLDLAAGGSR